MEYFLLSFLAGILTILAPCILPVLPIIIGGSLGGDRNYLRPIIISASLGISIIIFTLVLKISTVFINIPEDFWKWFSGGIILFFGLVLIFPNLWTNISEKLGFESSSNTLLQKSSTHKGIWGMILIGAALGPVFASCSPTYFLILGTVLPQNFTIGLINLIIYAFGLVVVLSLIGYFGQIAVAKLKWFANPKGWFKKTLGILFLIIGLAIITGYEKDFEAWILERGNFTLIEFEENLIKSTQDKNISKD